MAFSIPSIRISKLDGDNLIYGIKSAISALSMTQKSQLYLYNYPKKAIVISYDGDYKPFLGFSTGYNQRDDRKYLVSCSVLEQIGRVFKDYSISQALSQPGGRIFITKKLLIHDKNNISFLTWEGHDDIVKEIKKLRL